MARAPGVAAPSAPRGGKAGRREGEGGAKLSGRDSYRPACRASGFAGSAGPGVKSFRDGTDRLVPPQETLRRLTPMLGSMGITRVANLTGLDRIGIPVVMVCRPRSRALSVSQGKGLTLEAAKCSGIMESVESYHAERVELPLRFASYEELLGRGARVAEVDRLPRLATSSYDPEVRLLWVEGFDLLVQEPTWVPYEVVHSDYTLPFPPGSGCFIASSNGLASGNHVLEALSHALLEVVERDAYSLWRLTSGGGHPDDQVDLDSVTDPACRSVLDLYERAGVQVAAWDMTSDVGLPSFACRIAEKTLDPYQRLYAAGGMGCHLRPETALLRSLTEAAQGRLTAISGSRDDKLRSDYERFRDPETLRGEHARVAPGARQVPLPRGIDAGDSFAEDVEMELERLAAAGIEQVIAVDLTDRAIGVPVVRVVVPGLENLEAAQGSRYVLGRRAQAVTGAPSAGRGKVPARAGTQCAAGAKSGVTG